MLKGLDGIGFLIGEYVMIFLKVRIKFINL